MNSLSFGDCLVIFVSPGFHFISCSCQEEGWNDVNGYWFLHFTSPLPCSLSSLRCCSPIISCESISSFTKVTEIIDSLVGYSWTLSRIFIRINSEEEIMLILMLSSAQLNWQKSVFLPFYIFILKKKMKEALVVGLPRWVLGGGGGYLEAADLVCLYVP